MLRESFNNILDTQQNSSYEINTHLICIRREKCTRQWHRIHILDVTWKKQFPSLSPLDSKTSHPKQLT